MSNRIHIAWQMRHDLHQWLKSHIGSSMDEIAFAFPDVRRDTLRNTIKRLRADLNVVMVNGPGNIGRYSAVTAEIQPLAHTIDRLREAGRRNVKHALAGWINKSNGKPKRQIATAPRPPRPVALKIISAPGGPHIETIAPGHIRYRPGLRPISNQGGQGALRRDVTINCSHSY